jgi:SanA protein
MFLRLVLLIVGLAIIVLLLPRLVTAVHSSSRVYSTDKAPFEQVAIVFGAGLWWDGSPTPVLRDRVQTAVDLYFAGKVEKLLMSGSRLGYYNEPRAMKNYAISLGVPDEDIIIDNAGQRTYDTCYRASAIYGIEQAILITQNFHLPRALYTCHALGIQAIGVPADLRTYRQRSAFYWNVRELFATLVALWEVHVTHPQPVLGAPRPIFPPQAE